MLDASQGLGKQVRQILLRRYGLDDEFFTIKLMHEEELRINVFGSIRLDVSLLDLSNAGPVVFIKWDWQELVLDTETRADEFDEST